MGSQKLSKLMSVERICDDHMNLEMFEENACVVKKWSTLLELMMIIEEGYVQVYQLTRDAAAEEASPQILQEGHILDENLWIGQWQPHFLMTPLLPWLMSNTAPK
ncbi:PREDICTED: cyclic nucleotide-gated ion channel 1 [Prunus dulcis]|uniref:PREDICTED: cyclic nucleotide-gated ion channel 1 n=1 Tax=Prunus dulcis TaxID=3755 RepID=A0A5E4F6C2_PRUDU|nr:PREDICTED: cyclic nucleotide-gated ion channel 1 [Prunus dulcis]